MHTVPTTDGLVVYRAGLLFKIRKSRCHIITLTYGLLAVAALRCRRVGICPGCRVATYMWSSQLWCGREEQGLESCVR